MTKTESTLFTSIPPRMKRPVQAREFGLAWQMACIKSWRDAGFRVVSLNAPEEIEAVLAHELGHFKLRHVLKRTAWFALGSLVVLAVLGWLVGEPWFYAGLGVPGPAPRYGVALVLFMLALPVFTFLATPLASLYSRRHEFEADEYAAGHASAPALVSALVKLYEDNASTLTPDPLYSAFYDSHPPASARIARLEPTPA